MITKQERERRRVCRRRECLPRGLRGLEAILAMPDEDEVEASRRARSRGRGGRGSSRGWGSGRRPEASGRDGEDSRVARLEEAFLDGRVPVGWRGNLLELMEAAGIRSMGDTMVLQMGLAVRRSPMLLREVGFAQFVVEAR